MITFKTFTPKEELEVRLWVRDNFEDMIAKTNVWHPIVIDEVTKIINETKSKDNG